MSGQYQERKEYFKQYREKNRERLQQKRHDYYEENKDRIKEYAKQWKQDNPILTASVFIDFIFVLFIVFLFLQPHH